ncbi:hypothetical protein FRC04_003724 [Tulasnella sp. 424]|nr:hypothetical protein FRC04_003724 [Tulasnella sp. 424]KAG8977054.1 hypothetical protein FRC05_002575 [Tulasnella sp. 425]
MSGAPAPIREPPKNIVRAWDAVLDLRQQRPHEVVELDLAKETGMSDQWTIKLTVVPPGMRLHPPLAHSAQDTLITCVAGAGLVWQNGLTYPFTAHDSGGWKAGTGITYTLLNDAGPGSEDLVLLIVQENLAPLTDKIHFPLPNDVDPAIPPESLWPKDQVPPQNELGPHPGVVGIRADGTEVDVPDTRRGPRPSNISCALEMTGAAGTGELYCDATSLTEDTGLSPCKIGVNFEISPPGTKSSDAHAHKLEEELVFILGGDGLVWINGYVHPVTTGDAIGFPAGTGDSHTFINDSNQDDALGGHDVAMWIFGENKRKTGDKIYYPLNPENKEKPTLDGRWWDEEDVPKKELGPHPGRPARPAGLSL